MKKKKTSIAFKLSFLVILVEVLVFVILGYFYISRFSNKIDDAIITAAEIPATLMGMHLLDFDAVYDPVSIEKILGGEKVEDAIIFDRTGRSRWALEEGSAGTAKDIQDYLNEYGLTTSSLNKEKSSHLWQKIGGKRYLITFSPILYKQEYLGFLYLKIGIIAGVNEKRGVVALFTLGSLCGIIITTLGITFFSIRQFVFLPINKLLAGVNAIGKGEYNHRVEIKSRDEFQVLADSINNMSEQIVRTDKLKDDFLANTSHELRTPLNGIIGIAESLVDGIAGEIDANIKNNLRMIINSGLRLSGLVDDILDFSKIQNQDIHLNLTSVDIRQTVDIVLTLSSPLIYNRDLTLTNKIPASIPLVWADENRIFQVLHNLIGNALKFTNTGKISVSAAQENQFIRVAVKDTGIGIPEDKIQSIFKMFYQVDGSSSRQYAGTGLGLSITKYLIELHGGKIWVKSSPRQGSTFFFTLPVSTRKKSGQGLRHDRIIKKLNDNSEYSYILQHRRPAGHQSALEANILVVDDEPINLQLLANHLLLNNYHVRYALSGEEALKMMKETTFDAILLDVMMPRMSGFEVCRRIRQTFTPNQLPIIMITAKNQISDLTAGLAAGASDYIAKPVAKNELLARLQTHLEIKKLNQEIEDTQKELIYRVGAIAESRSKETANHVKRVAAYSALLAKGYGLPEEEVRLIREASPMHDIGKVAIPDSILNKPGKHTPEESVYMRKHARLGYEMIGKSERKLLKAAATIALTHHEKWDGSGYPAGLKGETIPIYGRITAVADVFDALGSDRCYKKAWSLEEILKLFKEQRGVHFDPKLVDIFFTQLDEFIKIRENLSDK